MSKRRAKLPGIGRFILQHLPGHPEDIASFTAARFHISRQATHRHLKKLLGQGVVIKTGSTKNTTYRLATDAALHLRKKIVPSLTEEKAWTEHLAGPCSALPKNVRDILAYGFTEIFNNVLEHAQARYARVDFEPKSTQLNLRIGDDGLGVFRKLQDALKLADARDVLLQLAKGKLTTDPEHHSGEGLFFTSRIFDTFKLCANGLAFIRLGETDWSLQGSEVRKGTLVDMTLKLPTPKTLAELFNRHTNLETFEFDKTTVLVQLSRKEEESPISRSQAKRILHGLDNFRRVTLDFSGVPSVGQGFVDEVFRVFKNQHPEIQLDHANANPEVEFMIRRSLANPPVA